MLIISYTVLHRNVIFNPQYIVIKGSGVFLHSFYEPEIKIWHF